ncbi:MAG TPA: hypothetical protein VNN22_12160 [Verrucomicrobiae bacterium]|nr:hypothetical protein [Verrucomicrobiae bacterium]
MKITTGILGCALVAGLMAFAPSQSQAGVVGSDGVLYSPLNLKLTVTTQNSKGKFTKQNITSKEVLKDLGFSSDVVLTISADTGNVVVVNKKSGAIIEDLTATNIMSVIPTEILNNTSKTNNNGQFTYDSTGLVEVSFESVDSFFDLFGSYTGSIKASKADKNGGQNVTTKADSKDLNGNGDFAGVSDGETVVTGSSSVKGNGKVEAGSILPPSNN